jgi:lipopolysaccharide O-acetyltransferase
VLGDDVFVAADSWLQAVDFGVEAGPAIFIGDRCAFAGHVAVTAALEVRFGEAVLVARNVYVSDHGHAYRDRRRAVLDQGIDSVAPVVIGDGAWLGQNSVICPGVTIGAGAVVAANSVVKDDVPDHCVAAGAPARVVRSFGPAAAAAR